MKYRHIAFSSALIVCGLALQAHATTETASKDDKGWDLRTEEATSADNPLVTLRSYIYRPEDKFYHPTGASMYHVTEDEKRQYEERQARLRKEPDRIVYEIVFTYNATPEDFKSMDAKSCDRYAQKANEVLHRDSLLETPELNGEKETCLANRKIAAQNPQTRTTVSFQCSDKCDQKVKEIQAQLASGKALKISYSYFYKDHEETYIPKDFKVEDPTPPGLWASFTSTLSKYFGSSQPGVAPAGAAAVSSGSVNAQKTIPQSGPFGGAYAGIAPASAGGGQ